MHEFWSHCIAHFARTLNAQQLNTWIKPLSVEVSKEQVLVNAPNRFVAQWVREKFLQDIELLARDYFDVPPIINLAISDTRTQSVLPEKTIPADTFIKLSLILIPSSANPLLLYRIPNLLSKISPRPWMRVDFNLCSISILSYQARRMTLREPPHCKSLTILAQDITHCSSMEAWV
jgi:chromosomal replication initiation ATPase DnaA